MSSEQQSGQSAPAPDGQARHGAAWDEATKESVRQRWTDILIALVRAYQGKRMSMWERIPNMMCAAARQSVGLDQWFTTVLRSLQISDPGTPRAREDGSSSLSQAWDWTRSYLRTLPPAIPQAERRALRLLTEETMTIVAEARLRWEEIKTGSEARRAAQSRG